MLVEQNRFARKPVEEVCRAMH
eukprot:SAG31_NODE_7898_length_1570_cov_1.360299_1_plen_21_part_10